MDDQIKEGSTVCLNSGGPVMTVIRVAGDKVICTWFDGSQVQNAGFPASALRRAAP